MNFFSHPSAPGELVRASLRSRRGIWNAIHLLHSWRDDSLKNMFWLIVWYKSPWSCAKDQILLLLLNCIDGHTLMHTHTYTRRSSEAMYIEVNDIVDKWAVFLCVWFDANVRKIANWGLQSHRNLMEKNKLFCAAMCCRRTHTIPEWLDASLSRTLYFYYIAVSCLPYSRWVLQHCTGFARLVWGRLRVHQAFVYSDWFVFYVCFCSLLPIAVSCLPPSPAAVALFDSIREWGRVQNEASSRAGIFFSRA